MANSKGSRRNFIKGLFFTVVNIILFKPAKALAQVYNMALLWRPTNILVSSGVAALTGNGSTNLFSYLTSPVLVSGPTIWKQVVSAASQTCALKRDGTLWAWGTDPNLPTSGVTCSSPTQIGSDTGWLKIVCGDTHFFGLKRNGTLWGWGVNSNGQLGLGDVVSRSSPTQIGTLTTWTDIAGASTHSVGIKGGELWVWGNAANGRLGNSNSTDRSSPVQVGALTTWTKVYCGSAQTYAFIGGTCYCFGLGTTGQLGNSNNVNRSSPVQLATDFSVVAPSLDNTWVIRTNGSLWGWGINAGSELGTADATNYSSPTQIGTLTTWVSIFSSTQSNSCIGIRNDGKLFNWGNNQTNGGNAGKMTGSGTNKSSPVQLGSETTWQTAAVGLYNAFWVR